jgi:hypothetical protein
MSLNDSINEESLLYKYQNEKDKQNKQQELFVKNNKVLTESELAQIKELIKENFLSRGKNPDEITEDFIEFEFGILYTHIKSKAKHSHHLNSRFSNEILSKIKKIMVNKFL